MQPVIVNVTPPPGPRFKLPKLPSFLATRSSKFITIGAAVVIVFSMVSFTSFTALTNDKKFKDSHGIVTATDKNIPNQTNGVKKSDSALPGGGIATGVGGTTGTNAPTITLTADPASVSVGGTATLKWSATNNPKECKASEDWSGDKKSSGEEKTQSLSKVQTYLFTLTCKTDTGTGFSTVSVGVIEKGGTGSVATRPGVTLAANPSSVFTGQNATLSWSVSNNPTSCTASGDWSGEKAGSGSASTGALSTTKTYTYTLTCKNAGGTGYATTTVKTIDPPPDAPLILIYSTPQSPVTKGTTATITWSVTNNPTSCIASGNWSGSKSASGSYQTGALNSIADYVYTLTCSNAAATFNASASLSVVPQAPTVSLTASPSSMYVGSSSTLNWSATNDPASPTTCAATGDWVSSGLVASGSHSTGTLNTAKTYLYTMTCTNEGGQGYARNVPLTVSLPPAPVVNLSSNPISVTSGSSSTLTWSATNNPTSCNASGDWSGAKSSSGTQSTGTLNTVKTYTYTLTCSNAGGSDIATSTVSVSSGTSTNPPVVTVSVNPSSIGTGSSATLSWSATNNPTSCTASNAWSGAKSASGTQSTGTMNSAGTFTYSLSCSNSAGSGSGSASLTVIAIPVVSISVSPTSINTGSSSTISWSATNSPGSCTAGGSWSGTKASSGSQSSGAMNTVGSYVYSLSCTNAGGSGSKSATLTVSTPPSVYCSNNTPCYGPNDLSSHNTAGNCWAYNSNRVVNITSLNNGFHKNNPGNLLPSGFTSICGNVSIASYLSGSSSIPSIGTHNHNSSTKNNSGTIAPYLVGYYDATKP